MMKAATLPKLPHWLASTETSLLPAILAALVVVALVAIITGVVVGKLQGGGGNHRNAWIVDHRAWYPDRLARCDARLWLLLRRAPRDNDCGLP